MTLITTTAALEAFCLRQAGAEFLTVDTEFLREKTYWPQLCLIQVAGPGEAVAVDPLAEGLDLAPLFALMTDPKVLKVFHAARQDIEIFHHLSGRVPEPLFDTQVAAMVCGFGDSVSYETLVSKLAGVRLDKSSRFTDWSLRPLTERQLAYALSDVIHLRPIYEKLHKRLVKSGRLEWLDRELAVLTDPGTYTVNPETAWQRFKLRSAKPRFRAILRELAAWREREAQNRDLPRGRLVRDEALLEIAAHAPASIDDLARVRGLGRGFAEGRLGGDLLAAVMRGLAVPDHACPQEETAQDAPAGVVPVIDLLRVLLKMKSEDHHVAAKLIASASDLEAIAVDDEANVPALSGWRLDLFGKDALALKHGSLALAISGNRLKLVSLAPSTIG
ncbi:MAG: ribonuclease D [Rhodospirillaceae bacterium]